MERSACRTATSWAIGRATTVCRRLCRRKRKPSAGFTACFSAERPQVLLPAFLPGKGYPPPPARKSGRQARWRAFSKTRSTRAMPSCKKRSRWISSPKSRRKTKARCRSTMWRTAIRPSSTPPSGNWCSGSWSAGKPSGAATAVTASFPPAWSAETAAVTSAPRSGIPPTNTGALSGGATASSPEKKSARHRT